MSKKNMDKKRKLTNPYLNTEGYNCFGCSPDNKLGLQMAFTEEGEHIVCRWLPKNHFSGYKTMLHGGVQATLMDEIASWIVQVKLDTSGVTAKMDIRYIKSVSVTEKILTLKAHIEKRFHNLAYIDVELLNENDEICSTAKLIYYLYPEDVAKKDFSYPGSESFFAKP